MLETTISNVGLLTYMLNLMQFFVGLVFFAFLISTSLINRSYGQVSRKHVCVRTHMNIPSFCLG